MLPEDQGSENKAEETKIQGACLGQSILMHKPLIREHRMNHRLSLHQ